MSEYTVLSPLRLEAIAARLGGRRTSIERVGMGPAKAAATQRRLATSGASPLVLLGFGGALSSQTRPGEVVVASQILTVRGEIVASLVDASLIHDHLARAGVRSSLGPIVSSPTIAWSLTDRERLGSFGAIAVDMESQWCAPLSFDRPFVVVRAISDVPGQRLISPHTISHATRAFAAICRVARALSKNNPFAVVDGESVTRGDR